MGWLPRISRFGTVHAVYAQEGPDDCGIACARMVNFYIKKDYATSAAALGSLASVGPVNGSRMSDHYMDQARLALCDDDLMARCGNAPTTCTYRGSSSSDAMQLASLVNLLGMGEWRGVKVAEDRIDNEIIYQRNRTPPWPIILGVSWNHGGGHWVVCDRYVKENGIYHAVVNDPYDGDVWTVPLTKTKGAEYNPGPSAGSWWGKVYHPYPNKVFGRFDGFIVRRKS